MRGPAAKALDGGGNVHPRKRSTLEWDVAGRCQSPVYREVVARPEPKVVYVHRTRSAEGGVYTLELQVRCRKCGPCRKAHAHHWRMRAVSELTMTKGRTWFVTLTLRPDAHFQMASRARLRLAAQGTDFDGLDPANQFAERHREISHEITLWLKRVRKESGVQLRYFLVAEAHKSGLPHYHAMVHEPEAGAEVRSRTLSRQWTLGFSQCKLVAEGEEKRTASYVAKYLSKDAISRVRASQGYGHGITNQP